MDDSEVCASREVFWYRTTLEPQVIGNAIRTTGSDNITSLDLPLLASITLPAIAMTGTNTIFYKITIMI
jgi:hypothetical protein